MLFYDYFAGSAYPLPDGSISGHLWVSEVDFENGEVPPAFSEYEGEVRIQKNNLSTLANIAPTLTALAIDDCPLHNPKVWPTCKKLTIANCPNVTLLHASPEPHGTVDISLQPLLTIAPDFKCKLLLVSSTSPLPPEMFEIICKNKIEPLMVMESSQQPTAPHNIDAYRRNAALVSIASQFLRTQDYLELITALQAYPKYAACFDKTPVQDQHDTPSL